MKHRYIVISLLVILLATTTLACEFSFKYPPDDHDSAQPPAPEVVAPSSPMQATEPGSASPLNPAQPSAPEAVAPSSPSGSATSPQLLFYDDFSDPTSGWDRVTADQGSTDYTADAYRIYVNAANTDLWANPGRQFPSDVILAVDATKVGGSDDNDFGLICRYQDTGNYYFFLVSSDGYYGIGIVQNGEQRLLSGNSMMHSDSIKQGNATNHIRAECIGNTLSLSVNSNRLAEVQDATITSGGDVGLLAGTFDTPGTEILFREFVVGTP